MAKTRKKHTRKVKELEAVLGETPNFFDSPDSKSILRADYYPGEEKMVVHFRGGSVYAYANIPSALWVEFYQAASKGKFFATSIRPMFAGTAA